jgi:hypothetical protein
VAILVKYGLRIRMPYDQRQRPWFDVLLSVEGKMVALSFEA